MTAIVYCPECGRINDIDGTGGQNSPIHDSPRREAVERVISDLGTEYVDESGCAFLTMQAYDGRLTDFELAATGAPMMAKDGDGEPASCVECGHEPIKRMLLLVEVHDEEQRLLTLSCDVCGFDPEDASDWEFDIRETNSATVHEWYCPECHGGEDGYPVWQDYLDLDPEVVSDWDDQYEQSGVL